MSKLKKAIDSSLSMVLPTAYADLKAFKNLILYRDSYLHRSGWMASLEARKPVDAQGAALPWMNYSVIGLLKQRLHQDHHVLEFGSGFSTQFLSQNGSAVVSIEHDSEWYDSVTSRQLMGCEIHHCPLDDTGCYRNLDFLAGSKFHIILVDGRDRVRCVEKSLNLLTDDGVIFLDDSDRLRYRAAKNFMIDAGFKALDLEGLKPTSRDCHTTTLFYRQSNCLDL